MVAETVLWIVWTENSKNRWGSAEMTIYKVLDETFVSRSDATRKFVYREKYFIPNGITRGYLKMGHMIVYWGNNKWNVVERGYSIPEINKMVVVGNVEYKELTAAVAKVVLEKAKTSRNFSCASYDRAKNRAKTFPGIAKAMAEQWGDYLLREDEEK